MRGAMTLVELLVVIVILGMLAVALTVGLGGKIGTANHEIARIQVRELADHVELFRQAEKRLPSGADGLQVLSSPQADPGSLYFVGPDQLQDPWGRAYLLLVPGPSGRAFEVVSYGADGAPGGDGEAADVSSVSQDDG